ncbi:MAG: hypothetical protein QM756_31480 [Polyangiaceae bacterium]
MTARSQQTTDALRALWDAMQNNKTGTGLNIEVWSAARRDVELKRRAAGLQRDARQVIRDAIAPVTQKAGPSRAEALATLSLGRAQRLERHRVPRGRRSEGPRGLHDLPRNSPRRI